MRIKTVLIEGIRGLRSVSLSPDGENFLVWGPNGSGKSGVVDALDFLFTGQIQRLTGKGTAGITLRQYGPHIGISATKARVSAEVVFRGGRSVSLSRSVSKPKVLVVDGEVDHDGRVALAIAGFGEHTLTRREILNFITADPSARGQQIQDLLGLSRIEQLRKQLVRYKNECKRKHDSAESAFRQATEALNVAIGPKDQRPDNLLEAVNQLRHQLGGAPLPELHPDKLRSGLEPSSAKQVSQDNRKLVLESIDQLIELVAAERIAARASVDDALRPEVEALIANPKAIAALNRLSLIEAGLSMIPESGACPLCEKGWPKGALHEHLERRLSDAKEANSKRDGIQDQLQRVRDDVARASGIVKSLLSTCERLGVSGDLIGLKKWEKRLGELGEALSSPVERYSETTNREIVGLASEVGIDGRLRELRESITKAMPDASDAQVAWDRLVRAEAALRQCVSSLAAEEKAHLRMAAFEQLAKRFEAARDDVLEALYQSIRDRFVELYRFVHEDDESAFAASLVPDGAGVEFKVDFFGKGLHPPHALHSEGHQDSMGLCLFLAVVEKLERELVDVIILDDVVMSIDSGHRRNICGMLQTFFQHKQFFITTHDRTWRQQLVSDGVLRSSNVVEFAGWSLAAGPMMSSGRDAWERIIECCDKEDVQTAAFLLRRCLEEFFANACDSLRGPVTFKLSGRWDLGDYLNGTQGQFTKLIKKAKQAAQSWGNQDIVAELNELGSIVSEVYGRTNAEQWAVNASVHYNNWANLEASEFRPVVDAFHDLVELFQCSGCGAMLKAIGSGLQPEVLKCGCGKVSWNLAAK